jgi:hypothetical protein
MMSGTWAASPAAEAKIVGSMHYLHELWYAGRPGRGRRRRCEVREEAYHVYTSVTPIIRCTYGWT